MIKGRTYWPLLAGLLVGAGLGVFILFGLDGWSFLSGSERGRVAQSSAIQVGSPAPDFELETITGEQVRLSNLRGSPVVLNFWATWCLPCKEEMPMFQQRYEQYGPQIHILAVNFAEPVEDVQAFVDQLGLTFDILLDQRAMVQELYRVRGYPTTFVLDGDGIIQAQHIGTLSEKQLDRYLAKAGLTNEMLNR